MRSNLRTSVVTTASLTIRSSVGDPAAATTRVTTGPSGTTASSGLSARASSRETSNRSSVRLHSTRTRSWTSSVGRPGGSSSAAVSRPVSGVRSSWATSAVKRCSPASLALSTADIESTAAASSATSSRGRPSEPIRAARSPWAMVRAVRAAVRRRLLIRSAANTPARTVTTTDRAAEIRMVRSSSATAFASSV